MKARTLPHSIEAEQALLGCVLINDEDTQFEILDKCKPSDFFTTQHTNIFLKQCKRFMRSQLMLIL